MYKYSPFQIKDGTSKNETVVSPADIMKKIMDRKSVAVDFHHKLMLIFSYLNLKGFKKMQKYRHIVESMDSIELEKRYMDKYSKIYIGDGSKVVVNPMNIMECENNFAISVDKKRAIIKSLFELWHNWEVETRSLMCEYIHAIEDSEDAYMVICTLEKELKFLEEEIRSIKKYISEFSDVDWCIKYIYGMQKHLHDKYEHEIEEFFED